ncbi:RNA polymerase sigma-70 factor, ECF subfamily [Cryobacterium flavum]|uniref:RNA polymerase sigma-70 factor, ECF subfamily n=2 Tax=Cryobacterium flavum TaxID=1424659 RepID=A0A5E9G1B3_9MICO|nr:sigma-70 family RNA polymerase sigma factor [Cryobacterium flavum]SDN88060.1 RNA polymerase sigma-70 factor, ECF subfamily [Cryobacterium flavum]
MADRVADAIARASAEETARIISTVIRMTGDFALAEDCAQDAFVRAFSDWRKGGIPDNPGAWLTTVAKRRAIDLLRHAGAEDRALRRVAVEEYEPVEPDPDISGDFDDRLRLIFTCCHPALPMDARVALTLRTVAGLTPAQIARAFLVTEPAMEKRLVRARAKIKHAGIPYRVPPPHLMPERRDGVLAVLYLLFTEGYSATGGAVLIRVPLLREAIRLTRLLIELMPDDDEVRALLALMLLHHARTAARTDAVGDIVTLEEQDRSLWDRDAITEALTILRSPVPRAGRYGLQAHIAACHLEASDAARTNFARIVELYDALAVIDASPIVELNRAVAVAMSQGPVVGLALIDELVTSQGMDDYYLLPATRADLLRRMGRRTEAATEYEKALQLAPAEAEKRYLGRRLAETRR